VSVGEVRQRVLMHGEKRWLGNVGVWQCRSVNVCGGENELGGAAEDAGSSLACVCAAQELMQEFAW